MSTVRKKADTFRETPKNASFKPVELSDVPAVEELLVRVGLGRFVEGTVTAPVGRNDVWAGRTDVGRKVLVKRLVGHKEDVRSRMRRMLSYERFAREIASAQDRGPRMIGSDEEASLVVFEYIENSTNGAELVVDEEFGDEHSYEAGRSLGGLHTAPVDDTLDFDRSIPQLPSARLLRGLPIQLFEDISFGELATWRLMQQDDELCEAVQALCKREVNAPKVPAHCDLRFDQFLFTEETLYITDWEEFRLADAARDVGSFAGEWLNRAVLDIVTARGDSAFIDVELTHEVVVQRGSEKMTRLLPRVHRFCQGYRSVRTELDAGFGERATAFAGWHLLDRLMASAARRPKLSGIERAAAGVGRAALLEPAKFAPVLDFEELS